jgi:hypothetical protein
MGIFNKDAITSKLKSMKDSAVESTKKMTSEIKKSSEESKAAKAPVEGAIRRYGVVYIGGLPSLPKKRSGEIGFNIMPDSFYLKPTKTTESFFEDMVIPYDTISDFQIVKRTVSMAEGLMSNNSQNLATDNNIEITFTTNDGEELTLRLEMLTGISVDGQAVKCKELLDLLRQNQILKKIQRGQNQNVVIQDDIPTKIKKLNELKEAGIVSEEEFQQKKSELLANL